MSQSLKPQHREEEQRHQLWMLLDRSGSMASFGDAVVEGTNEFIEGQRNEPGHCRVTLATFDSQAPLDLIVEGIRLQNLRPLRRSQFQPRAMTPLYDAIGGVIKLADRREAWCRRRQRSPEQQTVMIYSDGLENASQRYDRRQIFKLITDRQQLGWVFVFMGANQDSYGTGLALGIDRRGIQNFDASDEGFRAASRSASRAMLARRRLASDAPKEQRSDFFRGTREAEDEMKRKRPG